MTDIIAKAVFDCIDLRGNAFQTTVEIGAPEAFVNKAGSTDYLCYVSILPLSAGRKLCSTDSLSSLGFAMEYIRDIFRTFVQIGGKVYFENTKTPLNLEDVRFLPVHDLLLDPKFRS